MIVVLVYMIALTEQRDTDLVKETYYLSKETCFLYRIGIPEGFDVAERNRLAEVCSKVIACVCLCVCVCVFVCV
jgi:hypothetical protein